MIITKVAQAMIDKTQAIVGCESVTFNYEKYPKRLWLRVEFGDDLFCPVLMPAGVTHETAVLDYCVAEKEFFIRSPLDDKVD